MLALTACGRDSIIAAANRGDLSRVRVFVSQGADVNNKDAAGVTALHYAARNGHLEVAQFLLEKGADANVKALGMTALMGAAQNGRLETARLLVEHGADVNAVASLGMTALMIAANEGDVRVVKLLIDHGADINAQTNNGATASLFATRANHPDVEKFLEDTMQTVYDKQKVRDHDAALAAIAERERSCPSNIFLSHRRLTDRYSCVTACPSGTQPTASGAPYAGARICASTEDAVPLLR